MALLGTLVGMLLLGLRVMAGTCIGRLPCSLSEEISSMQ